MNIAWVPYVISETVNSEVSRFLDRGAAKTFAVVAINDNKVSIEEAVQSFESLATLSSLTCSFKPLKKS